MLQYTNKARIKAQLLFEDTVTFMVRTYKQSLRVFSYASSYGQITLVLHNLFQEAVYYIQDSVSQLNFRRATRPHMVAGMAGLQGHNASRGKSARGEIIVRTKADVDLSEITGNVIYVPNYSRVKCSSDGSSNGLFYMLDLGQRDVMIDINSTTSSRMKIIQGKLDYQIKTGTGQNNQTFEAQVLPNVQIEDETVDVTVNGKLYNKVDSLLDIIYKEPACMVRTGITSGIDIIFGNSINAEIPQLGAEIRVDYIVTDGAAGNIFEKDHAALEFDDIGFDSVGKEIELKDIFDISMELNPDLGADAEDMELTKILAPNISRNFIIHDAKSIKYFLDRMNYFSVVKITKNMIENINTYKALLLPRLIDRLNSGEDYFSTDIDKFLLTDLEKTRILNAIHESGRKSANITIDFISPILKKFVAIIYIEAFKEYQGYAVREDMVELKVRNVLSEYLIANKRVNKIPHSDIVKKIDEIDEVDTVKLVFISPDGTGFDSLGNISIEENDYAVLRGGWNDKDGVTYEDSFNPKNGKMGSVNLRITMVDEIL